MEEYLPFVSIDIWTIIFTWINLVILFLLLKKFLFGPVNEVIDKRKAEIANEYKVAEDAKNDAMDLKSEYNKKIMSAKSESDEIIQSALRTAQSRSEAIVEEADKQAMQIIEKSRKQTENDRINAMDNARDEIAQIAVEIAEKIIGRELDGINDEKFISDIIDRM